MSEIAKPVVIIGMRYQLLAPSTLLIDQILAVLTNL